MNVITFEVVTNFELNNFSKNTNKLGYINLLSIRVGIGLKKVIQLFKQLVSTVKTVSQAQSIKIKCLLILFLMPIYRILNA